MATVRKLSLSKFVSFLSKKLYSVVSVYASVSSGKRSLFIEVRTPKVQRSFMVYVPPSKYSMRCDIDTYKIFKIHTSDVSSERSISSLTDRQIEYMTEIKGSVLDCDLISISNANIYLQKNNGSDLIFKFGSSPKVKEVEETTETEVDKIVKDTEKIMKVMKIVIPEEQVEDKEDIEPALEIVENIEEVEGVDDKGEDEEGEIEKIDVKEEEQVDLEFEGYSDEEQVEDVIEKPEIKDSSLKHRFDNSIPQGIEDSDISLGIIYYCIDLPELYKRLNETSKIPNKLFDSLEEEIIYAYDSLDDNENDIRIIKIDEITELASKIVLKSKEIVEKHKKSEANLKSQILKLSAVLNNTEKLQTKTDNDPKKFSDVKIEVDRLHKQTKTSLHEINIELFRNKDTTDEILEMYKTSLEEMLKIE